MTAATHSANDLLLSRRSFLRVSATVAGGLIVSLSRYPAACARGRPGGAHAKSLSA